MTDMGAGKETDMDDLQQEKDKVAPEQTPFKPERMSLTDRLALVGVVLSLLFLVFFMIDGAVMNFQCSFTDFIQFKCNRWDAAFKKWE